MSDLIPKHGGYRKLKGFQAAQLVYDITVRFVDRYINRFSRTKDQMVQAARSSWHRILKTRVVLRNDFTGCVAQNGETNS